MSDEQFTTPDATKSSPVALDYARIPAELRERPQWVGWCWAERDGKPTKVPVNARTGGRAKTDTPSTWTTFAKAVEAAARYDLAGIGYVFSAADDDPYIGIDLDHCVDPESGEAMPWAREIVERFDTYTEFSQSLTGLHILTRGRFPVSGCRLKIDGHEVEIYRERHFFACTGHHLPGTPPGIEERQDALDALYARAYPETAPAPKGGQSRPHEPQSPPLTDDEVLSRLQRANNHEKFDRLWDGDTSDYDGDDSRADEGLCCLIAFYTQDAEQIDRLFRRSALYREKWDESRGERTYGELTVAQALDFTFTAGQFYTGSGTRLYSGGGTAGWGDGQSFAATDLGNAQRLVRRHGRDLRYCHAWGKWLVWDGQRWRPDDSGEAMRRAKDTVRGIYAEAEAAPSDPEAKALAKWAMQSQSEQRLNAMIALARSEEGIPVARDDLDCDPHLLNVENGTLDLRTGTLRPHRREDYITKLAPVVYDERAGCPTWRAFLDRIFAGDADLIAFMQRAVGYTLTGDTSERAIFICHGGGANGKTTLLQALQDTLGDYALRTPTETLLARREGAATNDLARLNGARFVYASESEEGRRLDEAMVKDLTGGDDIAARFLHQEFFQFRPVCKIWLATNHKPEIRGTDDGIWDRIRQIPFAVRIPEHERDKHLADKLRAERTGILAWAVQGCLAWQERGLGMPAGVARATKRYRAEMDVLQQWIEEECIVSETAKASSKDLYASYKTWCEDTGEKWLSQRGFGARLGERGFAPYRTGEERGWRGIASMSQWHTLGRAA